MHTNKHTKPGLFIFLEHDFEFLNDDLIFFYTHSFKIKLNICFCLCFCVLVFVLFVYFLTDKIIIIMRLGFNDLNCFLLSNCYGFQFEIRARDFNDLMNEEVVFFMRKINKLIYNNVILSCF